MSFGRPQSSGVTRADQRCCVQGSTDVSFVRDYMYGLAHLVAWLQANFVGRVIWRLNPSTYYQALDETRKHFFHDSKIRCAPHLSLPTPTGAAIDCVAHYKLPRNVPACEWAGARHVCGGHLGTTFHRRVGNLRSPADKRAHESVMRD